MDIQSLRDLVMVTATRDVAVAENILRRYDMVLHRVRTEVLDFSSLANEAEKRIHTNSGPNSSERPDLLNEVIGSISNILTHQIGQRVTQDCSWGTKLSAVKTIVKIGETICEPDDSTILHNVQNAFRHSRTLEGVMLRCVGCMSNSERMQLRDLKDEDGSFFESLTILQEQGGARGMFEGLDEVVDMLSGQELSTANPTPSANNIGKREQTKAEDEASFPI
jgi:hypothetical protein